MRIVNNIHCIIFLSICFLILLFAKILLITSEFILNIVLDIGLVSNFIAIISTIIRFNINGRFTTFHDDDDTI